MSDVMVDYNDPVQIEDLLDNYVMCRALGHSWDEHPTPQFNDAFFQLSYGAAALRCVRCTTQRTDYIDVEMRVWRRAYVYPPRYKTIPGMGTRPNLRAELVRRGLLIKVYEQPKRGPGRPRKQNGGGGSGGVAA